MRRLSSSTLRDAGLHDPNAGLARILEEVHGQILAGEFSRDGNAVDFADRGHETSEQRAALEQRHETPETRGVARGGEPGETAADDRDFTWILERSHLGCPLFCS